MTTFSYSAINAQGVELKGELLAPDLDAARDLLRQRGLLRAAGRLDAAKKPPPRSGFSKKIDPKALQIFSRQFATLIEAGRERRHRRSRSSSEQTVDTNLQVVIEQLRADVECGMILSKALAQHPKVFDRLYVSMVEAGEAAGMLDQRARPPRDPDREVASRSSAASRARWSTRSSSSASPRSP